MVLEGQELLDFVRVEQVLGSEIDVAEGFEDFEGGVLS